MALHSDPIVSWQYLYDQARRLPQHVGYHPTCNEVRNWLCELMEKDGFDVDQYGQVCKRQKCADCGRLIPLGTLCNCNTSGDIGG